MSQGKTHKPTEHSRVLVKTLAVMGIAQKEIARHLGVAIRTLTKHYRDELNRGQMEVNAAVVNALAQNAIRGNVAAQIFWCKTRLNWRETQRIELTADEEEFRKAVEDGMKAAETGTVVPFRQR